MVTIIGGGIAGSALAGALARHGEQVTLYEQRPAGPGGGAFLFLDGRGHDALHQLGVDKTRLAEASYPITALEYADSNGRRAAMSRGHRFWMRADLMRILSDFAMTSDADLRHGRAVTDLTLDAPGHYTIHRGDEIATGTDDLLLGADGIDSVVRARLEPDRLPRYAGDVVLYGMTTGPVELDTEARILHFFAEATEQGPPSSTFGHIWRHADAARWFIRIARPPLDGPDDLGTRPVGEWAETVLAAAPSIRALAARLLEHTEDVHVSNARNVSLDHAATPSPGVVLIGDADHAITPAAGVGARDALEDALAIFQARTRGASPAAAMTDRRTKILADRELALRRRAGVSR